jgi:hypothetical protein
LGLKVVGLILALLLWFHVATDRVYDIDLSYQFHYEKLPTEVVMAAAPPKDVSVRLRASGKQLLRLWWSDRVWPIDLSTAAAGRLSIDLWAEDVPRLGIDDVEVLGIDSPGKISLWIDTVTTRTVPVLSNEILEIAPGHVRSGPLRIQPDSVRLTGARTLLSTIDDVSLQPIGKSEWDDSIDERAHVEVPTYYGIECVPAEVRVRQTVERFVRNTYDSLPVDIVMSGGESLLTADPSWVSVEVGGPASRMTYLTGDSVRVVYAAARNDTSGSRCPLWVNVPPPFQVLKVVPDSITVHRNGLTRTDPGT